MMFESPHAIHGNIIPSSDAPAFIVPFSIACTDIAFALNFRKNGKMNAEKRLHFINNTLKVDAHYSFPFTEAVNRKFYLSFGHISGNNNCFYYSPQLKGLLCLPCVLFAPDKVGYSNSQITGRLVNEPLLTFRKLTGKDGYLTTHLARSYHEDAVMQMKALKLASSLKKAKKITEKLNVKLAKQIIRNREILSAIIHEIETCGKLNIPLRGHRDSGSINVCVDREHTIYMQGNLRCLLRKAAIRDNILSEHLLNGPKNASYLSPETQNNLITCIGILLRHISNEIRAA